MKTILVLGHSHLNALKSAPSAGGDFRFLSFLEQDGAYESRLSAPIPADAKDVFRAAVFVLRGNVHIELGLVRHPGEPFDFVLPEQPLLALDAGARLLPAGLMASILARHLAPEQLQMAQLAASLRGVPCFRIESPPPLPDAFVERYPAGFAGKVAANGVAPLPLRYKLWRLNSRLVREQCAALGVTFVPVPGQAIDADGCLAEPCRRPDPAHANARYGDLVLDQLRALVHGEKSP